MSPPRSTPEDFALMQGGPLFRLLQRLTLDNPTHPLREAGGRVLFALALSWLPTFVLAWAGGLQNVFLHDRAVQAVFLFSLPTLLVGEDYVNGRIAEAARRPVLIELLPPPELAKYRAVLANAGKRRDDWRAELLIAAIAYGIVLAKFRMAIELPRFVFAGGTLTAAGGWYALVGLPLFWFELLRWVWRFVIWGDVLIHLARLDLRLVATHADRTGGLRYLAKTQASFSVVVFAVGCVVSALSHGARLVLSEATILEYARTQLEFALVALVIVNAPLLAFARKLLEAKRAAGERMDALVARHGRDFEWRWMYGPREPETPLARQDFSSQIDLASSFEVAEQMRWLPFSLRAVIAVIASGLLLPIVPRLVADRQLLDALLQVVSKMM